MQSMPQGRAARPEAASSVAPISHWIWALPASWPRSDHRAPATSGIPPIPPRIRPPVLNLVDRALVRLLPAVPRPVVKRIADRYVAGTNVSEACGVVRRLNDEGKAATIDVLGEEITSREEALQIVQAYDDVSDAIKDEGLDSNLSVKLTALGLKLDPDFCLENMETVLEHSGEFVRIDMEDSSCTDATLQLYRGLREHGYDRVGVVLQAYLRRTVSDVEALADLTPNVRLCKGIYVEPPEIAFQDPDDVRNNFVAALERLLEVGSYVGIATHDEWLIERALQLLERRGLSRSEYEFQMLLGVRPKRAGELVADGHRVRIYVPFGEQWYEYSLRRLQENPKLAGYIAADTIGRLVPGRNGGV
jgi:proline dehydrogenase